jgi:CubicO group peptidase (beta-lactamase class C family)
VRDGVFPAAQASVFHEGREVGRASVGCGEDTPFDLASLTKVLCTATAFVALWAEGKVGPSTPVSRWIDGSPLAEQIQEVGLRRVSRRAMAMLPGHLRARTALHRTNLRLTARRRRAARSGAPAPAEIHLGESPGEEPRSRGGAEPQVLGRTHRVTALEREQV